MKQWIRLSNNFGLVGLVANPFQKSKFSSSPTFGSIYKSHFAHFLLAFSSETPTSFLFFFFVLLHFRREDLAIINFPISRVIFVERQMSTSDSLAEEIAVEAQHQSNQNETRKDVNYKTKQIRFHGRKKQIILQNENGPCPLIAICKHFFFFVSFSPNFTLARVCKLRLDDRTGKGKSEFRCYYVESFRFFDVKLMEDFVWLEPLSFIVSCIVWLEM